MSSKDGTVNAKPLNIEAFFKEPPKNRIARVGVELEGCWNKKPTDVTLERDGSVFNDVPPPGYFHGEIPIGPMEPAALPKSMKKYYPQLVNDTCGLHVHMSFKSLRHYAWLMAPEYQETIVEAVIKWAKAEGFPPGHHIWARLSGKSRYCQKKFWPDEQVAVKAKDHNQTRHGHRYTMVHYCGRQNTIEVRLLPMMETVDQAIRAVKLIMDVTNACLVKLSEREGKVRIGSKIEMISGFAVEESSMEIPLSAAQKKRMRE